MTAAVESSAGPAERASRTTATPSARGEELDFDGAIVAHADWKAQLALYVAGVGSLDVAQVSRDDGCTLGIWLHGAGRRLSNEPAYGDLCAHHTEFHRLAGGVVGEVDAGHTARVGEQIAAGSAFDRASRGVVAALGALRRRVEDQGHLILDAIDQGILLVDANGVVQTGCSAYCHELLGAAPLAGRELSDALGLTGDERDAVRAALLQVFDDVLPEEVSLELMPRRFARGNRTIGMTTRGLRKGGTLAYLLVSLADDTRVAQLESSEADQRALLAILQNRDAFVHFILEVQEGLTPELASDQKRARRALHTVKGNASLFELWRLSRRIEMIEDKSFVTADDLAEVVALFRGRVTEFGRIIGVDWEAPRDVHQIDEATLREFEVALSTTAAEPVARRLIERLRLRRVRALLGPIEARVEAMASRCAKVATCTVTGDDLLVSPDQVTPVLRVLTHCIRNAVDHGVEAPERRAHASKPRAGRVELSFESPPGGGVTIRLRDDGRGIRASQVAAAAIAAGRVTAQQVRAMPHDQRLALVFEDGVSTTAEPTELSGRGVGMAAVRAAVHEQGGIVELRSEEGQFTEVRISLPVRRAREQAPCRVATTDAA